MTRKEFQELIEEEVNTVLEINERKGHDYAGDEDAMLNFREAARRLNLTPEQVWGVYADKHWAAVMTYCAEGQVESEPIEGRIRDIILYGFLLLGLIADNQIEQELTREMPVAP